MTGITDLKALLLAHDLSDAEIARRATMLREGVATIAVPLSIEIMKSLKGEPNG